MSRAVFVVITLLGLLVLGRAALAQEEPKRTLDGKTLAQWARQLESKAAPQRTMAASAIGIFGPDAKAQVPALLEVLKGKDPELMLAAAQALWRIEKHAAAPARLREQMGDKSAGLDQRLGVASALWQMNKDREALTTVVAAVKQKPPANRLAAAALVEFGPEGAAALKEAIQQDAALFASIQFSLGSLGDHAVGVLLAAAQKKGGVLAMHMLRELLERGALLRLPKAEADEVVGVLVGILKQGGYFERESARAMLAECGEAAVPSLAALLKDAKEELRLDAVKSLAALAVKTKSAGAPLAQALADSSSAVREAAADGLTGMGDGAKDHLPKIVALLKDEDRRFAAKVSYRLDKLGPAAADSASEFAALLGDKEVGYGVAAGLASMGSAGLRELEQAARHKDQEVRSNALSGLRKGIEDTQRPRPKFAGIKSSAPEKKPVPLDRQRVLGILVPALRDSAEGVRSAAAEALLKLDPPAKEALPALIEALPGTPRAIAALGALGPDAKAAVPELIKYLSNEEAHWRGEAALALGRIGPHAKAAVEPLRGLLTHEKPLVRARAALALYKIGKDEGSVAVILEAYKKLRGVEGEGSAVDETVEFLGEIGPDAKTAIPELLPALKDKNTSRSGTAREALAKMGPPAAVMIGVLLEDRGHQAWLMRKDQGPFLHFLGAAAVPPLLEGLQHKNPDVRRSAVAALGNVGEAAGPAVPKLVPLLSDRNLAYAAADALAAIGEPAKTELLKAVESPVVERRIGAAGVLIRLRPAPPEAFSALFSSIAGEDEEGSGTAQMALSEKPSDIVPQLVAAVGHEHHRVRVAAIEALGRLEKDSPQRKAVVSALTKALEDQEILVQVSAARALRSIDPELAKSSAAKQVLERHGPLFE